MNRKQSFSRSLVLMLFLMLTLCVHPSAFGQTPINPTSTDDVILEINSNTLRVKDGGIAAAKIAGDAVDASKIAADAVGSSELAADSVGSSEIAAGAVDTSELADDSVTLGKMDHQTGANVYVTDSSGVPTALAKGTDGQVLVSDGTSLSFADPTPGGGSRNHIINGDFRLWQRGTNFVVTTKEYTADRWYYTGNGTVSRQDFTDHQTDVPGHPIHFLRLVRNSGSQKLEQRIENVKNFAGKEVTFSICINCPFPCTNI